MAPLWYVRAVVKKKHPPKRSKKEMRSVRGDDESDAKERFEFLLNSDGWQVKEFIGCAKR